MTQKSAPIINAVATARRIVLSARHETSVSLGTAVQHLSTCTAGVIQSAAAHALAPEAEAIERPPEPRDVVSEPEADRLSIALIVLLTALTAITPLSIDMPLPGLPAIAAHFAAPAADTQFVVGAFLSGFAIAHLIVGSLADRFGRKPVLLTGLTLYGAAGIVASTANDLDTLLVIRVLQGMAACSGPVIARAIISDRLAGRAATRALAFVTAGMGAAPILAPSLGAAILGFAGWGFAGWSVDGWRMIFLVLAASGLTLLVVTGFGLGETIRARDPAALRPARMFSTWGRILSARSFLVYMAPTMLASVTLFGFLSGAPFALIAHHGVSEAAFGLLFATVMVGYVSGATLAARLAQRLSANDLILRGGTATAAGGITMGLLYHVFGVDDPYAIVLPMAVVMLGIGLLRPGSVAMAMAPFRDVGGSASAMVGFLQMGSGALAGAVLSIIVDGTPGPMIAWIAVTSVAAPVAFLIARTRLPASEP